MELTLILPKKIERKLKEECERSGASIEELALEALCRGMDEEIDPSDRAELQGSRRSTSGRPRISYLRITFRHQRSCGVLQL